MKNPERSELLGLAMALLVPVSAVAVAKLRRSGSLVRTGLPQQGEKSGVSLEFSLTLSGPSDLRDFARNLKIDLVANGIPSRKINVRCGKIEADVQLDGFDDSDIKFNQKIKDIIYKHAPRRTFKEIFVWVDRNGFPPRRAAIPKSNGSPLRTIFKDPNGPRWNLEIPALEEVTWEGRCQRCGSKEDTYTMSRFNLESICDICEIREKAHPAYSMASKFEREAVTAGVRNFPGIGLPFDLRQEARVRQVKRKGSPIRTGIILQGQKRGVQLEFALTLSDHTRLLYDFAKKIRDDLVTYGIPNDKIKISYGTIDADVHLEGFDDSDAMLNLDILELIYQRAPIRVFKELSAWVHYDGQPRRRAGQPERKPRRGKKKGSPVRTALKKPAWLVSLEDYTRRTGLDKSPNAKDYGLLADARRPGYVEIGLLSADALLGWPQFPEGKLKYALIDVREYPPRLREGWVKDNPERPWRLYIADMDDWSVEKRYAFESDARDALEILKTRFVTKALLDRLGLKTL
jgi:hypothetical protein